MRRVNGTSPLLATTCAPDPLTASVEDAAIGFRFTYARLQKGHITPADLFEFHAVC